MRQFVLKTLYVGACALALSMSAGAQAASPAYPEKAPIAEYQMASRTDEIALARSAAPSSISGAAEIMTLGPSGYESAAAGANGFVCLIQRAWASSFSDAEFWNPRERTPICFNAAAARSVLPRYLERTRWVLAGATKAEMEARTRAAVAAGQFAAPEAGAMAIMISKRGYLSDDAGGPWHPHVMIFYPAAAANSASWGANLSGAPLVGGADAIEPVTTFFIPVRKWSDGTPDTDTASASHMTMSPDHP
jgi:hypothetical protein